MTQTAPICQYFEYFKSFLFHYILSFFRKYCTFNPTTIQFIFSYSIRKDYYLLLLNILLKLFGGYWGAKRQVRQNLVLGVFFSFLCFCKILSSSISFYHSIYFDALGGTILLVLMSSIQRHRPSMI